MIKFELFLSDDSIYTEKNFKELLRQYHNNDIVDNTVELSSLTFTLDVTYKDDEVVNMASINTIEKMQKLIVTLKEIETLSNSNILKLNAIFDLFENELYDDVTLLDCFNKLDDYELWEDYMLDNVVKELITEGYFGKDVTAFYGKHPKYVNIDEMIQELEDSNKFFEVVGGVLEYLD